MDTTIGQNIIRDYYFLLNKEKFEEKMRDYLMNKSLSGFDFSDYPSTFIKFAYTKDDNIIIVINISYKDFKKMWEFNLLIRHCRYLSIGLSLHTDVTIILSIVK